MPSFFFFTEVDAVGSQADTDAFGPVVGSAETQFRVTSTHRALAGKTPNAYAVCDGLLLVQNAGNNLVNLILKPTEQPPFAFPKIKFFIYRGITKSTLVSGNDVAPSATNDLTKSIWDSQQAKNASAGTSDNAPAEALGVDITSNGPVDDVFYRENVSYQLPFVRAGWSLGQFDPTGFGFEMMVEAIGFDPELPLVRMASNIVTVAALSPSPTQAEEFEHWHDKEAILNYIDPCAYFGGFYFHTLKVKYANGSVSKKKKNEVYDDVLKGSHLTAANDGVFFNRNRTYLDIRNEYNHSINYFKNYGTYTNTDINCAFTVADPLIARNYYASHWPLMLVDNGDLPSGNTTNKNVIRLALPNDGVENPFPIIFLSSGILKDDYPRETKNPTKFIKVNAANGFTDELALAIPNASNSATTSVSSYIRLKYSKRFVDGQSTQVSSDTVIRSQNYLDCIFSTDMNFDTNTYTRIRARLYEEEKYIDSFKEHNYVALFSLGIAFDDNDNVTLFANPIVFDPQSTSHLRNSFSITGMLKSGATHENLLTEVGETEGGARVEKSTFHTSAGYIEVLKYKRTYLGLRNYNIPDLKKLFGLTITRPQWAVLLTAAQNSSNFNQRYRVYVAITNIQQQTDTEGAEYSSFDLALQGFQTSGTTLSLATIPTPVKIYTDGWDI